MVDNDFVIVQKIITDNAVQLRTDGVTQHREEIGHDDSQ